MSLNLFAKTYTILYLDKDKKMKNAICLFLVKFTLSCKRSSKLIFNYKTNHNLVAKPLCVLWTLKPFI